jgi:hypothetical protein
MIQKIKFLVQISNKIHFDFVVFHFGKKIIHLVLKRGRLFIYLGFFFVEDENFIYCGPVSVLNKWATG